FLMRGAQVFRGKIPLLFGAVGIILFAIMVGGGATVVRASIMALLSLIARATGRLYEVTIALIVAGFIMVLWSPRVLVFDPSFQLSFLATLGLIHATPLFERWLRMIPEYFSLRTIISATLGTQLFVLPLLLFMTGVFPMYSPLANALVLPAVPIA